MYLCVHFIVIGGTVHGGIQAVMLDTVCWFQTASRHPAGYWPMTSDITLHYLRNAGRSSLTGRARIIKGGRATNVVEAYTFDDNGVPIAHAVVTLMLPQSKL
jgi:uncharacterized protein (TIGR00369 family)